MSTKRWVRLTVLWLGTLALFLGGAVGPAKADVFTGTLYFTTFLGSDFDRLHSVDFSYNDSGKTLTLAPVHNIVR
jgi:hypothetical protein